MTFLSRLKISAKIMLVLAMLGIVAIGVALYGASTLKNADVQYNDLVDIQLPGTIKMARANRQAIEMIYAGYRGLAYDGGSRQIVEAGKAEQESYRQAVAALEDVAKAEPDAAERIGEIREKMDGLHADTARAVELGAQNHNEEARRLLAGADIKVAELSKALRAFNESRVAKSDKASDDLGAASARASAMLIGFSIVGLIGAFAAAMWVSRTQITGPIARLQDAMRALADGRHSIEVPGTDRADEIGVMAGSVLVFRDAAVREASAAEAKRLADAEQKLVVDNLEHGLGQLAAGDLTAEITADFSPTYASVKTNFNQALGALRDLIGGVLESTSSIQTGSSEIAQASEDLARRTEANAASLEETSAAITQMDQRLKASATASGQTVERADGAISTVSGGRSIADEAVQAMSRVADGAKGIDSVIEGLDKIAFQTRVLAMNAAVEAGRAGEAGRGFAVVADLVSALAMRSEEEAARARDQLTATQTDIAAAVVMVEKVDGALANISGDVGEVHTLLGQMATDNQAQSTAITQISVAVGTMDQSTQQNAAMVEQTSAAARNLQHEVSSLAERASRFRTGRERGAVRAVAASYTPPAKARAVRAPAPTVAQVKAVSHDEWTSF